MGANKHICFACRTAANAPLGARQASPCPACGSERVVLPHRFRPPKRRETEKWAAAQYLVAHGFRYQHLDPAYFPDWVIGGADGFVRYPENVRGAKEFVEAFHQYQSLT